MSRSPIINGNKQNNLIAVCSKFIPTQLENINMSTEQEKITYMLTFYHWIGTYGLYCNPQNETNVAIRLSTVVNQFRQLTSIQMKNYLSVYKDYYIENYGKENPIKPEYIEHQSLRIVPLNSISTSTNQVNDAVSLSFLQDELKNGVQALRSDLTNELHRCANDIYSIITDFIYPLLHKNKEYLEQEYINLIGTKLKTFNRKVLEERIILLKLMENSGFGVNKNKSLMIQSNGFLKHFYLLMGVNKLPDEFIFYKHPYCKFMEYVDNSEKLKKYLINDIEYLLFIKVYQILLEIQTSDIPTIFSLSKMCSSGNHLPLAFIYPEYLNTHIKSNNRIKAQKPGGALGIGESNEIRRTSKPYKDNSRKSRPNSESKIKRGRNKSETKKGEDTVQIKKRGRDQSEQIDNISPPRSRVRSALFLGVLGNQYINRTMSNESDKISQSVFELPGEELISPNIIVQNQLLIDYTLEPQINNECDSDTEIEDNVPEILTH